MDWRDGLLVTEEYFRQIAFWANDLDARALERARSGIIERVYEKGAYICHKGDRLDSWTGVVSGVIKLATTSITGKTVTLAGLRAGGWFGEGTVLKNEPRQYDLVALRDTRLVLMNRATFLWLFENSVGFNRFLVGQLNERLGQFIALVEYDRMLDSTARMARCIAWLFNPVLYRDANMSLEITQEELGSLSGISRQAANKSLKELEERGLLRIGRNAITILDLDQLRHYGD